MWKVILLVISLLSTMLGLHAEKQGSLNIYFPDSVSGSVVIEEWVRTSSGQKSRTVLDSARIENHCFSYRFSRDINRVSNVVMLKVVSHDSQKYIGVFNPYIGTYDMDMKLENTDIVIRINRIDSRMRGVIAGSVENDFYFQLIARLQQPEYFKNIYFPSYWKTKQGGEHYISDFDIIRKYPRSMMLLDCVNVCRDCYSLDSLEKAFGLFDEVVRNTYIGKHIQTYISARKSLKNNSWTNNFAFYDKDGTCYKFPKVMNGKRWGLIVFWASWCGPCRKEIPLLIKLYEKYKNQVAFVSLSVDEQKKQWLKAVKEQPVPWLNLSRFAADGSKLEMEKLFMPSFVPSFLLVDDGGNILVNSLSGAEKGVEGTRQIDSSQIGFYLEKWTER